MKLKQDEPPRTMAKPAKQEAQDLMSASCRRYDCYSRGARTCGFHQAVMDLAAKKGCSPQFALAWVLAQGDDMITIPGTKRVRYLKDNMVALAVNLTPDDPMSASEESALPVLDTHRK